MKQKLSFYSYAANSFLSTHEIWQRCKMLNNLIEVECFIAENRTINPTRCTLITIIILLLQQLIKWMYKQQGCKRQNLYYFNGREMAGGHFSKSAVHWQSYYTDVTKQSVIHWLQKNVTAVVCSRIKVVCLLLLRGWCLMKVWVLIRCMSITGSDRNIVNSLTLLNMRTWLKCLLFRWTYFFEVNYFL